MTEDNYYDEYEIDLREYIMLLWNKKWFIIALFIIAVIAAGLYSTLMVEPTYKVVSNLLILPPRYTTSLEVSTLPIETYRNLAMTDSIKQKIIDELNLKNKNGEIFTPAQLDNMMSIEIVAQGGENQNNNEEQVEAPLLKLKVKGKDPQKITDIANTWADEFMVDSKEIRTGEVREVTQVIESQYESTETKLEDLKERLLEFKKENRLEIANKELTVKKDMLAKYNNKILELKTDLGSEKEKYLNLSKQINRMEIDGEWTGELSKNFNLSQETIRESKKNYLKTQQKLIKYKDDHNLEILKSKIANHEDKLNTYQQKKRELEIKKSNNYIDKIIKYKEELKSEQAQRDSLIEEINNQEFQEKWKGELSKINSEDQRNTLIQARKNYLELEQQLLNFSRENNLALLRQKINVKKNELKGYRQQLNVSKEKLNNLEEENVHIKNLIEEEPQNWELKKSIDNNSFWQKLLQPEQMKVLKEVKLTDEIINPIYKQLKNKYENNNIQIRSLPNQINFYENKIKTVSNELDNSQDELQKLENKRDHILSDFNHYKKIYGNYANNYVELKNDLLKSKISINSLEKQISYFKDYQIEDIDQMIKKYTKLIEEQKNTLRNLNTELFTWEQEIDNIKSDLQNYKKIYQNEAAKYRQLISDKLNSKLKIESLETQLNYYQKSKSQIINEIQELQDHIWEAENTKETLTLRVENVKSTYNMLAKKVEEARISEAQKTSDVKFIARAVPPTQPVGGNLKLNVAIAGVLALMLGVFIVFFREFLKEDEEENYKA